MEGRALVHCALSTSLIAAMALSPAVLRAQPSADFDWTMPARYGMDERTAPAGLEPDELIDYLVTFRSAWDFDPAAFEGSPEIDPSSWRVDFDAGASSGAIAVYRWAVDGEDVGETAAPRFSHQFPAEGRYSVTLTVSDAGGGTASRTRDVTVQDWLIVAIGDSYASGEGNPEVGDLAWFEALVGAYAELQDANADVQDALADLRAEQIELEVTLDEAAAALAALDRWNRECPSLSLACAQATSALITELGKLGFNNAEQMLNQGVSYIRNQIDNLTRAAQAAVAAAQAAVDVARGAVDAVQAEIDVLFREGAAWQTMPSVVGDPEVGRPEVGDDRPCHRASFSGQSLAALALERADPRTSVTFVHVACSGAQVPGLIDAQLPQAAYLIGEREVDALIVSIGGNDAGFSRIVTSLVAGETCDRVRELAAASCSSVCVGPDILCDAACDQVASAFAARCDEWIRDLDAVPFESAQAILDAGLEQLRSFDEETEELLGRYKNLQLHIAGRLPGLPSDRVFITEYPNLVEGDDGEVCPDYLTVSHEAWEWIGDEMTVRLNDTVRLAAGDHGWSYVEGIFDGFRRHGYCADDHWVIHPEESFIIQGDGNGSVHPNVLGHAVYGERIGSAFLPSLYPAGLEGPPRAPGYGPRFRRGEANGDGAVDISDPVTVLQFLFVGGAEPSCLDAADADDSGVLDITDAIRLFGFLFLGGSAPPEPGPAACGRDPTDDALGCAGSDSCP